MDDFIAAERLCKHVLDQSDKVLSQVREEWCQDLSALSKVLSSWCVPGWELHEDSLLEHEELVKKMIANEDYGQIAPAIAKLDVMREIMRDVSAHCTPRFIDASLLKQAKECSLLGAKTVAFTYLMFMMREGLPAMKMVDRIKKVDELKAGMQKKIGKPLKEIYVKALGDLCK